MRSRRGENQIAAVGVNVPIADQSKTEDMIILDCLL